MPAGSRISSGRKSSAAAAFSSGIVMHLSYHSCDAGANRTLLSPRHRLGHRVFPILAVEQVGLDGGKINAVQTTDIDVDLIGIRTRDVERMDTAARAKCVLRGAGVESISRQRILAA